MLLTQTFLWRVWHCFVMLARIHAGGGNAGLLSATSMVSSDLTASIWGRCGPGWGSTDGVDGKFQCVLTQRRAGVEGSLPTSQMTP